MRRMMLSLAVGAVLLSGCAWTGKDYYADVDYQKIARVEHAARAVGVNVYWVNLPTKSESSVN